MQPEAERKTAEERSFTLRTRLPLYLIGLLLLLQLVLPDRTWTFLLSGLGIVLGVAYAWARALFKGIVGRRHSRGSWVVVGDEVDEVFTIENRSIFPALWVTVQDESHMPGYAVDRVAAVGAQTLVEWQSEGWCRQRGVFTLGPWTLATGDPLGLFSVTLRYNETRTLMVYPRAMKLPEFDLPRGAAAGRAPHLRPSLVESVVASHVRPYQPGDSLHLVHWRKSAQSGELMVREFDIEPAGDLWLVLDLDAAVQAGAGEESTLEYGVLLAASLAAKHLATNRAVGLVAYGATATFVPPQPGTAHLWRILHALAQARPGAGWPLNRVLRQVAPDLGRGRTLAVITPSLATDWPAELLRLSRQGIASAAVLLDAPSFGRVDGGSLPALCALLAEFGFASHVISQGYNFQPLTPIRRKRTVLRTLSGRGRVIPMEIEEEI